MVSAANHFGFSFIFLFVDLNFKLVKLCYIERSIDKHLCLLNFLYLKQFRINVFLIQVFPGVFNILLRILEIIGINGNVSKNQVKLKVN